MNFKEWLLAESTQASIIVKMNDDKYGIIYVQSNGYLDGLGKELSTYFTDSMKAKELVSKSGDIADITKGNIEFSGKNMLKTNLSEEAVVKLANEFASYKYYFDGNRWLYSDTNIIDLDSMKKF